MAIATDGLPGAITLQLYYSQNASQIQSASRAIVVPKSYNNGSYDCTDLTVITVQFDNGVVNNPTGLVSATVPATLANQNSTSFEFGVTAGDMQTSIAPMLVGGINGGRISILGQDSLGNVCMVGQGAWLLNNVP